MSETPWMKWYPSDWRGDPLLRACEPLSRYVWMEMIGLMHEAEPYGHLILGGKAMDARTLGRVIGVDYCVVKAALKELEAVGVFSRDDQGVIYSRRMIRDQKRVQKLRENGSKGGNPKLRPTQQNQALPTPLDNQGVNPVLITQSPESRVQSPDRSLNAAASSESPREAVAAQPAAEPRISRETIPNVGNEFDRMQALCSHALGDKAPVDLHIGPMLALVAKGYPESVIVTALVAAARTRQKPIRKWSLWASIIEPDLDKYVVQPPKEVVKPVAKVIMHSVRGYSGTERKFTADQLREQVAAWHQDGTWDAETYGYPPSHRFCDLPWFTFMTREQELGWTEDNVWPTITPRYLTEQAGEAKTA